METAEIVLL